MIEAKKRGRPPVAAAERKRANVTIRMRDRLYNKVTGEAAASQRSLSEEIERSLEDHYAARDKSGVLGRIFGAAVEAIELQNGKEWHADETMRVTTRIALAKLLDSLFDQKNKTVDSAEAAARAKQFEQLTEAMRYAENIVSANSLDPKKRRSLFEIIQARDTEETELQTASKKRKTRK